MTNLDDSHVWIGDFSHFDRARGPMNMKAMFADGLRAVSHKATEATFMKDAYLKRTLENARDAGFPFLSAYMVPRTPGNSGAGSVPDQVKYFLDYVHQQVPWLFDFEGRFFQVDTEIWSRNGKVYDHVSPVIGNQCCVAIGAETDATVFHYVPKWGYGDTVPGTAPLWSSAYPKATSTDMRKRYIQCGGDAGPGWVPYSHRRPPIWQYGGGAVTIGTQHNCDISAFKGTTDDFATLIGATVALSDADVERIADAVYKKMVDPDTGMAYYVAHQAQYDPKTVVDGKAKYSKSLYGKVNEILDALKPKP
jgi:hypothetical protein